MSRCLTSPLISPPRKEIESDHFWKQMNPNFAANYRNGEIFISLFQIIDGAIFQKKGTNPDIDSYSVFFDNVRSSSTGLDTKLKSANVRTVFVSGLATDYCVGFTTLDALSIDLNAFLITDASRGVTDPTIADMLDRVVEQGGILVNTDAVLHLMDNLSTVETSTSSRIFLAPSLMVTLTFWTLFRL